MNWLKRFMAHPPIKQITLANVQDDTLVERTKQRQQQARDAMGTKWIGHHRHAAKVSQSRLLRDWDEAITEDRLRSAPRSIVNFHRRFK